LDHHQIRVEKGEGILKYNLLLHDILPPPSIYSEATDAIGSLVPSPN